MDELNDYLNFPCSFSKVRVYRPVSDRTENGISKVVSVLVVYIS